MTEYSISFEETAKSAIIAAIESFGDRIIILGNAAKRIKIETDQLTADELAVKASVEVHKISYATMDMGMQDTFMRIIAERLAGEKNEENASAQSNPAPKTPDEPKP